MVRTADALASAIETTEAVGRAVQTARSLAQWMGGAAADSLARSARDGETLVLIATPSGLRAVAPGDEPLGVRAALITYDEGTWHLRALSPGDVPSEAAARPLPERLALPLRPVPPVRPMPPGMREQLDRLRDNRQPSATPVMFRLGGRVEGDAAAVLLALEGAPDLRSVSAESADGGTRVEAVFGFETVEAWADWRARAETAALLAAFEDGTVQTRLDHARTDRR